ncbi:hypothetical protein LCGC14_0522920 [marine sediment metagenome]|uniref:Uncharacterized protein n=1 Tax=marine sediment metagenome TaxID=412755 RepID=A0A0F9RY35_9ZZZZ
MFKRQPLKLRIHAVVKKRTRQTKFPERIETSVSANLKQRIENLADSESISVAAYVRRLLDKQVPGGI